MKRKEFEEIKLSNGIRIFHLRDNSVEWADMRIIIPLGSAHNTGNVLPGSYHFLEHMVGDGSEMYPQRQQFRQFVGIQGGYTRASTGYQETEYRVKINHRHFEKAWKGLCSNVFSPLLREEDVIRERSIIANERDIQNYYAPCNNTLEHSLRTKWMNNTFIPNSQVMGKNEDLDSITAEYLKSIHANYFTSNMIILLTGKYDLAMVIHNAENLSLISDKKVHETNVPTIQWKEQHATIIEDRTSNFFAIGSFSPGILSFKELTAVQLLGNFFANSYQGPLFQWLRVENPWIYNVSFKNFQWASHFWYLNLSFSKKEYLEQAKVGIHEKLSRSIRNNKSITTQVIMELNDVKRSRETTLLSDIASVMVVRYGHVPTDKEWEDAIKACRDPSYVLNIYEKHFAPDITGECSILMKATR